MSFETTLAELSLLDGLQGAAVIHLANRQVLAQTNSYIDMEQITVGYAEIIQAENRMLAREHYCDLMQSFITTTPQYYHILKIIPFFDDVALYVLVNRQRALPLILQDIDRAMDLMV